MGGLYIEGALSRGITMACFTQITGFWLFFNAYKHFINDRNSYRNFLSKADRAYNEILDMYVSQWHEMSRDIQNRWEARMFLLVDKLLKMLGANHVELRRLLLQLRNKLCHDLYLLCRPLLLQSLEISP